MAETEHSWPSGKEFDLSVYSGELDEGDSKMNEPQADLNAIQDQLHKSYQNADPLLNGNK